jgi:rRNA maturation protein Nop10
MDILACPNCGSRKIYQGTMGDGVLTGYTFKEVCRNCGYQGMPIIFSSEEEYKKFLIEKLSKKNLYKNLRDVKKEKIVINKRPIGVIILVFFIIIQAIFSIYLYYELLWVKVITFLWIYYISIFILSAIILPYGFFKGRQWAWTIGGVLFALSIPIGLIFLFYITRPNVKTYFGKK